MSHATQSKPAASGIVAANEAVLRSLPFDDTRDLDAYAFLDKGCPDDKGSPDTANPSLRRQSRLCAEHTARRQR
ncbi:hypothetical protein ACWFRJ_31630 [Streptomyces sp. NPDC055239]